MEKEIKMVEKEKSEAVKEVEKKMAEIKEPVIVEKLELGSGEVYVGNLSDADKYQLISRRMTLQENQLNQMAYLLSNCTICLQEIARKQGIEIDRILNFGKDE